MPMEISGISVPFLPRMYLDADDLQFVFGGCVLKKSSKCINTRLVRRCAQRMGRKVFAIHTAHGRLRWSEMIGGTRERFEARLLPKYAATIDKFDEQGAFFRLPLKSPFGPVKYRGPSKPRTDAEDVSEREARRLRHEANVKAGTVNRSSERTPQYAAALRLAARAA